MPAPRIRTRSAIGALAGIGLVGAVLPAGDAAADPAVASLSFLSSFDSGAGEAGSEIVSFDRDAKSMVITNGATGSIDVVSLADPANPTLRYSFDLTPFGADVQSVAAHNGIAAAVVSGPTVLDPGQAVFFRISSGQLLGTVPTGVLPDAVTWSHDGRRVVIANEGEPRCVTGPDRTPTTDPLLAENPEGSITVVEVSKGGRRLSATQIGFTDFDDDLAALQAAGVRVGTWPGSTVAQDLEPEYPTIDGDTAYVTLQENNAVAVVDLRSSTVTAIVPLGTKDHSVPANAIDASDRDGGYLPSTWPLRSMYMPDTVTNVKIAGRTYLLTANEGDTRTYFSGLENAEVAGNECFADEVRVRSLPGGLDPAAFGGATAVTALRDNTKLGRLKVSAVAPSVQGATGYTSLAAFGGRSFSMWDTAGNLVWDSASLLESTVASLDPTHWPDLPGNAAGWATAPYDNRSDDKGPEPEAIEVGFDKGRTYAFVGLERAGGIMMFDLTQPESPQFLQWIATEGQISPESIDFVPSQASKTKRALLLVANEISGTTTVYQLDR